MEEGEEPEEGEEQDVVLGYYGEQYVEDHVFELYDHLPLDNRNLQFLVRDQRQDPAQEQEQEQEQE